jgi:hypothetical protein
MEPAPIANARLLRLAELDPSAWDDLTAESPDATIFHSLAWLALADREIPGTSVRVLVLPGEGGRGYAAALPFARMEKIGFRHSVSLPAGAYGGVLLSRSIPEPEAAGTAAALLARFDRLGRAWNAGATAVTFAPGSALARALRPPGGFLLRASATMFLDLRPGIDAIRRGYSETCRSGIRRAEREGVTAVAGRSSEDLDVFYGLYEAMLAERVPYFRYERGFFERAAETLGERMTVWVARHGGVPVSAKIVYRHRGVVHEHFGVVRRSARDLRPHHFLMDRVFADACASGAESANLGGSYGNPGIQSFKASFGGRPVEVIEWVRESPAFRVAHALYEVARSARARGSKGGRA